MSGGSEGSTDNKYKYYRIVVPSSGTVGGEIVRKKAIRLEPIKAIKEFIARRRQDRVDRTSGKV